MPAVTLLSKPVIISEGQTLTPPKGKTSALLYYLAYQNDWVNREDILYLFWPDTEEHKARANLRQLLRSLKKLPYLEQLEITTNKLYWPVKTDVHEFKKHFSQKDFSNTIAIYKGALLEGLRTGLFPEYESWLEYERSSLFASFKEAVYVLAHEYEEAKRFKDAAELLEKLYKLEPFDETCLKAFLSYLKLDAQFEKLEIIYQQFEKQLWQELDAKPSAEIQAFFETVRTNEGIKEQTKKNLVDFSNPMVNLPTYSTPFIGRSEELASLAAQILDESCRLITLLAAGGMGKTRLATELAKTLVEHFSDGVCFVPFEAVETPAQMLNVVIEALEIKLSDGSPMASLVNFLESKTFLLIFDNLEHLTAYTNLITEILSKTPNIKIVATSRERLNLHSEWIYDLEGLKLSTDTNQTSDAQMLFTKSAKKARSSFKVNDDNKQTISKICERLGGMPLALELAASWLRIISVEEVLEELEQGLELLKTSVTDLPERHLDVASVFESSWLRLSTAEKNALINLAVFEGGFSREAAHAVADIGLPLLLLLINKSFLKHGQSNRFTQHPLMLQFIRVKANETSAEFVKTQEKHAGYFMNFVKLREGFEESSEVKKVRNEFNLELPNIRLAWQFASKNEQESLLNQATLPLFNYFLGEGRFIDGSSLFHYAIQTLKSKSLIHARILHRGGALFMLAGNYEKANDFLQKGLALSRHHDAPWDIAYSLFATGVHHSESSELTRDKVYDIWRECAELFAKANSEALHAYALTSQSGTATDYLERESLIEKSLSILKNRQESYFEVAANLKEYGKNTAYTYGDYKKALSFLEEAVSIERLKGNPINLGNRAYSLGQILRFSGDYKKAEACFLEILALSKNNQPWTHAMALQQLTYISLLNQHPPIFKTQLHEALELKQQPNRFNKITATIIFDALSCTELASGNLDKALNWSKKSLESLSQILNVNINVAWTKIECLNHYGKLLLKHNDLSASKQHLTQALRISLEWHFRPATLDVLLSFAELYLNQKEPERALPLIALSLHDPSSMFETTEAARKQFETFPQKLQKEALELAKTVTLERLVEDLLLEE